MNYYRRTCPNGTTPYTIRRGDTFYRIARRMRVSLDALLAANPGINPDRLYNGQIICIPTSTPPTPLCPLLRYGSRGNSVKQLQQLLKDQGFNPGTIDGIFGVNTRNAVIAFQRNKNLIPDGIVGPLTWAALGVNCTSPTPTCPPNSTPYIIKAGDTFYSLAVKYNTTVDALRKANPNVNPNALQIGQQICIPK